jgi:hypothetical protein
MSPNRYSTPLTKANMTCPHLEYRRESDGKQFDSPRAYCTVTDQFVQAMRADICNDRYNLDHTDHCEIYRENTGEREP